MAGLCVVIQKASSALIFKITMVLIVTQLALCLPVPAGGNGPVQTFYCKPKGCAENVTQVFCEDEPLLNSSNIPNCSGPPQLNSVCQHDGRAFVSTSMNGDCDFEADKEIPKGKCTDHNSICLFNDPTSSQPVSPDGLHEPGKNRTSYIVIGVVVPGLVLLLVVAGLFAFLCKKRRTRQPDKQLQRDHRETEALNMHQRSGDVTEKAPQADPGLDDDTAPFQHEK
ncbi:uncharacterized protein LOC103357072 [Stegastes partitus]|uniref:Uncharacterized protein LOC103357072 n=1 Tax=Stegastes partitus TaxID=144197 RepID=A0A9Y4JNQ0_9TELE|nr:PREDICTED: uncharacterized protein LOC103357072 [Stegastes partitus]